MSAEQAAQRITLRRVDGYSSNRVMGFVRRQWKRRWVKWLGILLSLPVFLYFILWFLFARGLPSAESLLSYEPVLPTYVRDINGQPVQSFARERRVQLTYDEFPPQLINAFLAAEDRTFFRHGGLDYPGLMGAVIDYISKSGSGERAVGGSTITQQVAKIFFTGDEYSVTRKIREAFLAHRIEAALTKEQILELYMNQIFLGRNAYGVQAAARAYFGKDVEDLTIAESAYLAVLPKAPANYDPIRRPERALERRNWVLGEMARNGFITAAQRDAAVREPLGTVRGGGEIARNVGGYFMEEVRRTLIQRYGENADPQHPNSVYAGGLWVRTSYNPMMQRAAETALRDGLTRYERGRGWRDPGLAIDVSGDWRGQLAIAPFGPGYDSWRSAVVLSKEGGSITLGFTDGSTGTMPASLASMPRRGTGGSAFDALRPGAIVAVEREGDSWALRSTPEVSGGMVVEEVATGRILAMQGGFDVRGADFNRATQAMRQPGSTFKPIVYAAALDNGMTPASIIIDGPFCANQGTPFQKCFRNFGGSAGAGPQTMRWGLEQSRNLMTVRAASQVGMDRVTRMARQMGVGDYRNFLAISLGAGDSTVLKMTNAFATFANQGRALNPTLIDYIQDRRGRVIWRADTRPCQGCNAPDWDGRPMPRPPLRTRQVIDAMTAYQVVHMLEGVVQRGTATILRDLGRPIFGKTGTSTGPGNVWFIGGSAEIVAGVYIGFDRQSRSLGGYAQGGTVAAPIFRQFARTAFEGLPVLPFRAPQGIRMVAIDRRSGHRAFGVWPGTDPRAAVIWEAFKPESEPRRTTATEAIDPNARRQTRPTAPTTAQSRDSDFLQREGGIY